MKTKKTGNELNVFTVKRTLPPKTTVGIVSEISMKCVSLRAYNFVVKMRPQESKKYRFNRK